MKPHITVLRHILPAIMAIGSGVLTGTEVEAITGYKDITIHVYEAQDMNDAIKSKNDVVVILHNNVTVTDETVTWDSDALFNLSNYYFTMSGTMLYDLTFSPTSGSDAGKVVRNGRAEFCKLNNLTFSGINNTSSDITGTYTPFQPYSLESGESLLAATDILNEYGYGGVFNSASGLTNGENGGVSIHDCYGDVTFSNLTYDGSSMGDVDCGIHLMGGAIYTDEEWNTEITNNGIFRGGNVTFSHVSLNLDRSVQYANSSQCRFYAYGGAIYTRDLIINGNYGDVIFSHAGINQTAAHKDEGYGYGGALYLKETANSLSYNAGNVLFENCAISVANTAEGGAIYLKEGSSLSILGNSGDVTFSSNTVTASAIDGLLYDDAQARGGAIFLGENSSLIINNNISSVIFDSNSAAASATVSGASVSNAGGAIYGSNGSLIRIEGNRIVHFTNNSADQGSAICTEGSLSIRNNDEVLFSGNSGDYAICMSNAGAELQLSAAAGKKLIFEDNLYTAGSATINSAYNNLQQDGSVELVASTATIKGGTSICGGNLTLRQGSTLNSNAEVAATATLIAKGTGNKLEGNLTLKTGGTLSLHITRDNSDTAVLNITGSLGYDSHYNLDTNFIGIPEDGKTYILLQLAESSPYALENWNTSTVTVTGDLAFDELKWKDNYTTLVYTYQAVTPSTSDLIWMKSAGTSNWNLLAKNWVTQNDSTPTRFTDGSSVFFTDACTDGADVVIRADVAPEAITVDAERDYVFTDGSGKITGTTSLVKSGSGCLTLNLDNDFSGGVELKEGTLRVQSGKALGTGHVNVEKGATLVIEQSVDVNPPDEGYNTVILGNLQIGKGAAIAMMDGDTLQAESVEVNGHLYINPGAANNGAGAQKLSGTGSIHVTYAHAGETQAVCFGENTGFTGSINLSSDNVVFTVESGGYEGSGTLETDGKGNSIMDFNGEQVTILEGGLLHIDYGNAIIAGNISLQEGSILMAKEETTPDFTLMQTAEYTGPIQTSTFTLMGGTLYQQYGGYYSLAGVDKLILDGSNGLSFTLFTTLPAVDASGRENSSRYILFTDVADWETIGEVNFTITGANVNHPLYLVYEGTTLYLDTVPASIPEPNSATLILTALAALAARRRREKY